MAEFWHELMDALKVAAALSPLFVMWGVANLLEERCR